MKRHRSLLASSALLLSIALSGTASAADKWSPQVELEGKAGTSGRKIGVTKLMAPLYQDNDSVLFNDIRYKFDNQDSQEYNLGLGYREKINNDLIIGGYGFFDRLRSDSEHLYSQGTVGLEALTEQNDLRMNVYIPESTKNAAPGAAKLVISGTALSVQGGFERALPGADFEIGQRIDLGLGDFRVYGGGYSFSADGYDSVTGPRGRMELKLSEADIPEMPLGATLTVGAELQRDDVRGTEGFGLVKLTVPLWESESKSSLTCLDKRMMNFIQRDVDVVSGNGGTEAAVINGAQVNGMMEMDSGETFVDIVNAADSNTLILVDGSNGTVASGVGTATMKQNQAIIAGGSTVQISGAKSGVTFNHTFSGSAPTVDATSSTAMLIDVANNVTIDGLTINNSQLAVGSAEAVSNVTINNLTVNDSVDDSINFDEDITNLSIDGFVSNNSGNGGIYITGESSNISITDAEINNSGNNGIYIINSEDVTIDDVSINITSANRGIYLSYSDGVEISNVEIIDSHLSGIELQDSSDVTISDVSISSPGDDGIKIYEGSSNISIDDVSIDSTFNWGVSVEQSSVIDITNVEFSDTGDDAIKIQDSSSNINISDIVVDLTGSDGFAIDDSSDITISDVEITGTSDSGIDIDTTTDISVTDVTISDAGYTGIEIHDNSNNVTITNAELSNSDDDGILIDNSDSITITGGTISGAGDEGIEITDSATLTINGTTITDSHDDAIEINGTNSDFDFSDLEIVDNITGDGIDVDDVVNGFSINNVNINNVGAGGTAYGYEFNGATITGLTGTDNTNSGQAGGGNCSTTGATITGSLTYNTNQTCP